MNPTEPTPQQPAPQPPTAPIVPPPQPQYLPPNGRRRLSKKQLLIIGGAVLVVIILIIVALGLFSKKPNTSKSNAADPSLYTSRPGYAFDGGLGDPYALQVSDGGVQTYGGEKVIQACGVFTPNDVTAVGQRLQGAQLTGTIKRTYFDGKGLGSIVLGYASALPFDDDANSCLYRLDTTSKHNEYVSLAVFQPSYVKMTAVTATEHNSYAPAPASHGLQVFKQKPTNDALVDAMGIYILQAGDNLAVQLTIAADDTNVQAKVLDRVAANLVAAQTKPTPLPVFSLKSPIFTGGPIVRACDLLDNDTYKAAFHVDASPLVTETASTSIGVVTDLQINGKPTPANYGASDCERHDSVDSYLRGNILKVFTETYETVEEAKAQMVFEKTGNPFSKNVQESKAKVGDESFYADADSTNHALIFRKGRAVIKVGFGSPASNSKPTPDQAMQVTIPAAQAMLKHLQNF
ncbi:MAG TPA: hypothetical protein VLG40_00350 [Candidatus Saccharimonas sp.]|nr:hypothetical protein [Candidatus Saccharimonas sp.]